MPIIFLRERTDLATREPRREVVDGQQRLRTLIAFIEPAALPDFNKNRDSFVVSRTHNKEISGKTFAELPDEVQKQILEYGMSVHVFPPGTDDREILEIFARLNSTGVKLNPQELRNARYFGVFKQTMYSLGYEQLTRWREWQVFSEMDIARMSEVELVSELVFLMYHGLRGKSQPALNNLYKKYDEQFTEKSEVQRRFHAVMDSIDDVVGRDLPSLEFSNVALFHTLFTHFYDLMFGLGSDLTKKSPKKMPRLKQCIVRASRLITTEEFPEDVARALRGQTTHGATRSTRLNFLREVCAGATA
jgi:hypothetical protein